MIDNLVGILIYAILFISILGAIAFGALIVMMLWVWIDDMKFKKEMKKRRDSENDRA